MDKNKKVTWADKRGSWSIYVELNTKITTQSINQSYFGNPVVGDSKSALDSIYSIFKTTREIVTIYGDDGKQLAGLAFKMLNEELRPFATKWHVIFTEVNPIDINKYYGVEFQENLKRLQSDLSPYVDKFLEMSNTDDLLLDK